MSAGAVGARGLSVGTSDGTSRVLRDVSLSVAPGEALGIVGESGSGKSTLAFCLLGAIPRGLTVLSGDVQLLGEPVLELTPARLRGIRGRRIALVSQDPSSAFTPTSRIGELIAEPALVHRTAEKGAIARHVAGLLDEVGLPAWVADRYPHEVSGGQRQRAALALALSADPAVLVLDEPSSSLDTTTQAAVVRLLTRLRERRKLALVWITHDLGVVGAGCTRVAVLYAGSVVETGAVEDVLNDPLHPYTQALLQSVPAGHAGVLPTGLPGTPPSPDAAIEGCRFVERCPAASEVCASQPPPLVERTTSRLVACYHPAARASLTGTTRVTASHADEVLLAASGLSASYGTHRHGQDTHQALADISLEVHRGETLAIVGESGSGKSTLLRVLAGLHRPTSGVMFLGGMPLAAQARHRPREARRALQIVFQHADQALNPRHRVARDLRRVLESLGDVPRAESRDRSVKLLGEVGLGAVHLDRLPRQLSGGERQRVAIARALAAGPDLLLCDEVTSALDVSVQARILHLLDRLRRERQLALIFVTHNLAVARAIADHVIVLRDGRIYESGAATDVFTPPHRPYTAELLAAALSATAVVRSSQPALGAAPTDGAVPASHVAGAEELP
jgi:peptide/nickel transport system ATP-binding protein